MKEASPQNINFKDLISKDLNKEENLNSELDEHEHDSHENLNEIHEKTLIDNFILKNEIVTLKKENSKFTFVTSLLVLVTFAFLAYMAFSFLKIDSIRTSLEKKEEQILNLKSKIEAHDTINTLNNATIDVQQNMIDQLKKKLDEKPLDLPLPPLSLPIIEKIIPPGQLPVNIDHLSKNEKEELRKLDFKLAMIEKDRMIKLALVDSEKNLIQKEIELLEMKKIHSLEVAKTRTMDDYMKQYINILPTTNAR